ncbi:MAG: hypothetical protein PUB52_05940 [Lachnospiraceae bacterium]|nr:hypothetical protein [Lachnospiraceae bacterium]MDD6504935.1 hypothetical protein [Lachnospiraceae bacterium]
MYKNQHFHYEDTKSTGYSFTLVGILGILLIVLMDTNVLPITMADYMKIILTIVMGGVFVIFVIVGIRSFWSLKSIEKAAEEQDDFESTVMEQFLSSHTDALQDFKPEGYSEEEIYYPRSEEIRKLLIQDFPSLDDEQLEYFIERIYSKIYG